MLSGSLPPISRRSTYVETLKLKVADTGEPLDLTGASIDVKISLTGPGDWYCSPSLSASLGSGVGLVGDATDGIIQWRFETSNLNGLAPGNYRITVTLSRDDDTEVVLSAILPVID